MRAFVFPCKIQRAISNKVEDKEVAMPGSLLRSNWYVLSGIILLTIWRYCGWGVIWTRTHECEGLHSRVSYLKGSFVWCRVKGKDSHLIGDLVCTTGVSAVIFIVSVILNFRDSQSNNPASVCHCKCESASISTIWRIS